MSFAADTLTRLAVRDTFEFVWPIDGSIEFVPGPLVTPRHLVLLLPGRFYVASTQKTHVHTVGIQFTISNYPAAWPQPRRWPSVRELLDGDICLPLLKYIKTHQAAPDPVLLRHALSTLLAAFVTGNTTYHTAAAPVYHPAFLRALDEIRGRMGKNYGAQFTPDDIANAAGMGRKTLDRYFKRYLNHTPAQEFYLARLDRAVHMLAYSKMPIAVVAAMAGFSSDMHLNRHCRAHFGMTTKLLRRNLLADTIPFPSPRSPLLWSPFYAEKMFKTEIPPLQSLPYPPNRSMRKLWRQRRREKLLARLQERMAKKEKQTQI